MIEFGCGTGQLSNFLSVANRTVFGTDIGMDSLALGRRFRREDGLRRVHFMQTAPRPAARDQKSV